MHTVGCRYCRIWFWHRRALFCVCVVGYRGRFNLWESLPLETTDQLGPVSGSLLKTLGWVSVGPQKQPRASRFFFPFLNLSCFYCFFCLFVFFGTFNHREWTDNQVSSGSWTSFFEMGSSQQWNWIFPHSDVHDLICIDLKPHYHDSAGKFNSCHWKGSRFVKKKKRNSGFTLICLKTARKKKAQIPQMWKNQRRS